MLKVQTRRQLKAVGGNAEEASESPAKERAEERLEQKSQIDMAKALAQIAHAADVIAGAARMVAKAEQAEPKKDRQLVAEFQRDTDGRLAKVIINVV